MALPKSLRFEDRREVRRLLTGGRRFGSPLGSGVLRAAARNRGRVLFVVPTASAKRSTERHRIKRHLDEWVQGAPWPAADVIIFINRSSAALTPPELLGAAERTSAIVQRLVK